MPIKRSDAVIIDRKFVVKNAGDVFYKYKAEIIEDLTSKLVEKHKDEGLQKLIQSIDVNIFEQGNKITFELSMEGYWKFVDQGVDGYLRSVGSEFKYKKNTKRIPIDAMKKFISARGITPAMSISAHRKSETFTDKKIKARSKKVNKEDALNSLAFAMGVNLKKFGIKPTHFFSEVVNADLTERLKADLAQALKRDIEVDIKASFNE